MSNQISPEPRPLSVTMTVRNQAQARELDMAWREITSGQKLVRTEALEHDEQEIMDRAQEALRTIETAIGRNPTSGQARRLVRFLAGLYNGQDYPFDLTDLRALDTELANACLDYLNYELTIACQSSELFKRFGYLRFGFRTLGSAQRSRKTWSARNDYFDILVRFAAP